MNSFLRCLSCHAVYAINEPIWKCACGGLLDIKVDFSGTKQWETVKFPGLWKYLPFIPLPDKSIIITLGEGQTPIIRYLYENQEILIKQEQLFPTGSYKDRGAAVMISAIKAMGIRSVVEDSSGNAGCSVAAYCAKAGIDCSIYVPASTSRAKLMQISAYGARVVKVEGTREDTARMVLSAASQNYYASHSWNPFFFQGTKTFAYEVWEQTEGKLPDAIILPVGNGTLFLGVYKGFHDLLSIGLIEKIPRMVGVQASLCAPLSHWEKLDFGGIPIDVNTIAEGIAIQKPVRGAQIIEALHQTHGMILEVEEEEIEMALRLAVEQGFFVEPTGVVGLAGTIQYLKRFSEVGKVLTAFTGHGLKSPEKILSVLSH